MNIPFEKYHGTGNDFILIDNRKGVYGDAHIPDFKKMCARNFGIGADGLMLVQHCSDADFEMIFYNPDGSKSLCGNGSRCAISFAKALGIIANTGTMRTTDGLHQFEILAGGEVAVSMHNVHNFELVDGHWFIDTGSPHLMVVKPEVAQVDIQTEGRNWRLDPRFESINGCNVNFVETEQAKFKVRTYERGVENETLSCGTGVTAVALSLHLMGLAEDQALIHTRGGILSVKFKRSDKGFGNIYLQGPAQRIYSGTFYA